MKPLEQHKRDVLEVKKQLTEYVKRGNGQKLIFTHIGSHSTREKSRHIYNNIDISHFQDVISINTKNKVVFTEPSVPMDKLVYETLKFGLLPEVIPEFPKITVGGAIEGAALESSSFKYGQFNDCCIEYNVITAQGKEMKATRSKNSDIFYGKSGSYGSLGLLTSVKLRVVRAHKYVLLSYITLLNAEKAIELIRKNTTSENDYVEGIIFGKNKAVIIVGKCVDEGDYPIQTFSKPSDPWFYEHANEVSQLNRIHQELVPINDYLFRYDRGAYWMGKYFMQYVGGYNFLTRRLFDSSLHTKEMYEALHLGNLSQSFFVQDFYVPIENMNKFIDYVDERLGIYPIWLCPMKSTQKPEKLSPHYNKSKLLVNVGIYGRTKKFSKNYFEANRDVERKATELNARKMLYAHAYYPLNEFWKIYDKKWYDSLRKKYHADKVLSDVFERTHVSEVYKPRAIRGAIKFYLKKWLGKK